MARFVAAVASSTSALAYSLFLLTISGRLSYGPGFGGLDVADHVVTAGDVGELRALDPGVVGPDVLQGVVGLSLELLVRLVLAAEKSVMAS